MSVEYDGVAYYSSKRAYGEIDPVYPDKQQDYVPLEQCGHPHNYLNGWKCINCGHIKPTPSSVTSEVEK